MDSVERASGNIPPSMPSQETAAASQESMTDAQMAKVETREEKARAAATDAPAPVAVWTDLAAAGVAFLEKLSTAFQGTCASVAGTWRPWTTHAVALNPRFAHLARDERTGEPCLKLPLPKAEVLKSLADLLGNLAGLVK